MARVLHEHADLDRWRQWKIAETAENTFCIKVSTQDDKWVGYSGNFNVKK